MALYSKELKGLWNYHLSLVITGAISLVIVAVIMTVGACSHGPKSWMHSKVKPLKINEPVLLKLAGQIGREEVTHYYSASHIKNYEEGDLTRERNELVDFKINAKTVKTDPKKELIFLELSVLDKDGPVDLRDLAFPEVGETLEVIFQSNAKVVRAGNYPKASIFYVPPLSLPKSNISVGDTWKMQANWTSLKNGIPLQLDLVTIVKNFYPCAGGRCVDLEISGDVAIVGMSTQAARFRSEVQGRILFSVDKGTVVWSLIKSSEELNMGEQRTEVESCLVSQLIKPEQDVWPYVKKLECEPKTSLPQGIPGT